MAYSFVLVPFYSALLNLQRALFVQIVQVVCNITASQPKLLIADFVGFWFFIRSYRSWYRGNQFVFLHILLLLTRFIIYPDGSITNFENNQQHAKLLSNNSRQLHFADHWVPTEKLLKLPVIRCPKPGQDRRCYLYFCILIQSLDFFFHASEPDDQVAFSLESSKEHFLRTSSIFFIPF